MGEKKIKINIPPTWHGAKCVKRKRKKKKLVLLPFCSHESQKIKYGQRNGEKERHMIKTGQK